MGKIDFESQATYEALKVFDYLNQVLQVTANTTITSIVSIARLVIPSQSALNFGWQQDLVTALVSYDTLSASFNTIARKREADLVPYLSNETVHATLHVIGM